MENQASLGIWGTVESKPKSFELDGELLRFGKPQYLVDPFTPQERVVSEEEWNSLAHESCSAPLVITKI